MITEEKKFRWLHISDFHVGMTNHGWLWPTLKTKIFEDLEKIQSRAGPWDAVIFSGDLTQKAVPEEFDRLTQALQELWRKFDSLGFKPTLFAIPGNHDLTRPLPLEPEIMLLGQWWQNRTIHPEIFENPKSRYRLAIQKAFRNYENWQDQLKKMGIPLAETNRGLLPGDSSCTLEVRGTKVGIVGLNSAWLQLSEGNFEGRLHIDPRQLLAVTGGDSDKWVRANDFNLLVSHHPSSWLHPESLVGWNSEINTTDRFDVHLFGHMHVPTVTSTSIGGGQPKVSVQAPSLFGLEKYGEVSNRLHGYIASELNLADAGAVLKIWPRRAIPRLTGELKIEPDLTMDLDDSQSFSQLARSITQTNIKNIALNFAANTTELSLTNSASLSHILKKTERVLASAKPHLIVREVELQTCRLALDESRAAWIGTSWGMSEEGFIWALQQDRSECKPLTYRIECGDYSTRQKFLEQVHGQLGCEFEQYCDLLSSQVGAYLILSDIPIGEPTQSGIPLGRDIEELVNAVLQYCPTIRVLLLTRRKPGANDISFSYVNLPPLDEADTRSYIKEHPLGGSTLSTATIASQIFRHTDGVPTRIDTALKELQVTSLADLLSNNSDLLPSDSGADTVPAALAVAVAELADEFSERPLRRSYQLLKALSMFPQGEQLTRVKRFLGAHPFLPPHAAELVDRGLVDAIPVMDVGMSDSEVVRSLVLRRPVRDYVRSLMSTEESISVNEKAVELYFGEQWKDANYKTPSTLKFNDSNRGFAEISNATTFIIRAMKTAIGNLSEVREIKAAVNLALHFSATLKQGGHYRGMNILCEDFLPLVPEEMLPAEHAQLKYNYARSFRMLSQRQAAIPLFLELKKQKLSKAMKVGVLLNLALAYETDDLLEQAVEAAREVIELSPKSHEALQAEAIILEAEVDDPERFSKLAALENEARAKKATTVANNIAVARANQLAPDDLTGIRKILAPALEITSGDTFNFVKARIALAKATITAGVKFTPLDRLALIGVYQYLYNQRLDSLFSQCHAVLWHIFDLQQEEENLLRLFRHSSMIWRVRGRNAIEDRYVKLLAKRLGQQLPQDLRQVGREMAYFLARNHLVLESSLPSSEGAGA
ncbi:metallophosphoesterase [uncultured Ramlibacter sp.]|uniref:metallophosphoesterase n=1 Tax=uncultured Ramlibacter sp. TaxID=260755 RepID=UPI002636565E|nr:metallophosphoesterase [uncultured Ramlibacter sp.]